LLRIVCAHCPQDLLKDRYGGLSKGGKSRRRTGNVAGLEARRDESGDGLRLENYRSSFFSGTGIGVDPDCPHTAVISEALRKLAEDRGSVCLSRHRGAQFCAVEIRVDEILALRGYGWRSIHDARCHPE